MYLAGMRGSGGCPGSGRRSQTFPGKHWRAFMEGPMPWTRSPRGAWNIWMSGWEERQCPTRTRRRWSGSMSATWRFTGRWHAGRWTWLWAVWSRTRQRRCGRPWRWRRYFPAISASFPMRERAGRSWSGICGQRRRIWKTV